MAISSNSATDDRRWIIIVVIYALTTEFNELLNDYNNTTEDIFQWRPYVPKVKIVLFFLLVNASYPRQSSQKINQCLIFLPFSFKSFYYYIKYEINSVLINGSIFVSCQVESCLAAYYNNGAND